jgi:hypothetical protein
MSIYGQRALKRAVWQEAALTKSSNILPDEDVLHYLATRQGQRTCLWYGHFKDSDPDIGDVYYAFPAGTPQKRIFAKMRSLYKRGLVKGCPCGCRGDFEITDKGLALIGIKQTKPYTGY